MTSTKRGPIGKRVLRLEDGPLLSGQGTFAADWSFPDTLHMRVIRSSVAHGKIRTIDITDAISLSGVHAVWTAADVTEIPPIEFRATKYMGLEPYKQPVIAADIVRYVGEPVAVVFAEDLYAAEDAANQIWVDFEEYETITEATETPREFSPGHSTEATVIRKGYGNIEAAFEAAHDVVELELRTGRHSGVPLECRGGLARINPDSDRLEYYGATKRAHPNRDQIARTLRLAPAKIDLFEGNVGGGFGIRGELYPEDFIICAAALRFKRPIRWIEDRREHLLTANQSRQQTHKARAAIDKDGRILGIDNEFFHDQGGYLRTHGVRVPDMTAGLMLGPYKVPSYRVAGRVRLTNKTPAATYRAPGRYEGTFVRERLMDAVAVRVGIDPIEVRRRNLLSADAMPYSRPLDALEVDVVLESGDYAGLLDQALEKFCWSDLRMSIEERRRKGECVGAGIGFFVEKSGLGPTDKVRVDLDRSGRVTVVTGAANLGQGVVTVMAQICAGTLGCDFEEIKVLHGRTDVIDEGYGSHASRTTVMTGEATRLASVALREQLTRVAAEKLQANISDIDLVHGEAFHDATGASISFADIVATSGEEILSAEGRYDSKHMNYPYGVHAAVVSIDRETGITIVEKFMIAYDVGCAINPMLVEGQLQGGLAQGIGGALFEEFVYDDTGQPLSSTFADYIMPGSTEVPEAEVLLTEDAPSPLNPLGIKGAGEGGINAVGAAVASAIDDALQQPGAVTELPVTPRRLMSLITS
ncbi:MAG: 6-hydroxypseudooxynicotine dehydrogenase complex subunit gamma [Alphaproteobacteria bacterium MarineAlpha11_Bin1]|nr:MAG: 6-hydroxypseudooxynicotine dehydrogenase complex subunit gamma [Alphaproteobacteria bacterium MarineAlpha11_Bin1]|tara:strand:- start:19640 stop:21910 length:2271 start_codon:yes stop_codon:yes gene_type:complete